MYSVDYFQSEEVTFWEGLTRSVYYNTDRCSIANSYKGFLYEELG